MLEQPLLPNAPPAAPQAAVGLKTPVPRSARKTTPVGWLLVDAGLLACVGLSCVLLAFAGNRIAGQQSEVGGVIDALISAMAAGETDRAYVLFSSQIQGQELKDNLESSLTGGAFAIYADYRGLELSNLFIGLQTSTDPDEPQGVVANATGLVYYQDGSPSRFEAVLIREQGVWKLWSMRIDIAPEKLDAY
jgi:hypothetical protein